MEAGYVKIGDFRSISRYIPETVKDRDSYYEMPIGIHMEWRYFQ